MEGLFLALLVGGSVVSFAAGIWYLVVGFKAHVAWGISFLIPGIAPFAAVLFALKRWDVAKKPFILNILVTVLMTGVCGFGFVHSAKDVQRQVSDAGGVDAVELELPPFLAALVKLSGGNEEFETAIQERLAKRFGTGGGSEDPEENTDVAEETPAEPKSGLGKAMAAAKANLALADDRAKETGGVIESLTKKPEPKVEAPASTEPEIAKKSEPKTEEPAKQTKAETENKEATSSETAEKMEPAPVADVEGYAPAPRGYAVVSLIGTDRRRTAMITGGGGKNYLVAKGDRPNMKLRDGSTKEVEIIDITADAVIIQQQGWAVQWAIPAPKPKK